MPNNDKQLDGAAPQQAATKNEGGHGTNTQETQHSKRGAEPASAGAAASAKPKHDHETTHAGGARLEEGRQQHDEAEKNSEANRVDEPARTDGLTASPDRVGHGGSEKKKHG